MGDSATARLSLDASGFDRQANTSLRQFAKSLSGVKDGTDLALKGAETLQKMFVKSLGAGVAIGAATALSQAMRDVGRQIGEVATSAMRLIESTSGIASGFSEGISRAQKFSTEADKVTSALEAIAGSSIVNSAVFKLFGGDKVLTDLKESLARSSAAELGSGLEMGVKSSAERLGAAKKGKKELSEFDRKAANEQEMQTLKTSPGYKAASADQKKQMEENLRITQENNKAVEDQLKTQETNKKIQEFLLSQAQKRAEAELEAADAQRSQLDPAFRLKAITAEQAEIAKAMEANMFQISYDDEKRTEQIKKQEQLEKRKSKLAEQQKKAIEEQAAEQRKNAEIQIEIEKMQAQAKGPEATLEFLKKQSAEADKIYEKTGKLDDKLAAMQAANKYQSALSGFEKDKEEGATQRRQASITAASETLDIAQTAGGPYSGLVEKERKKADQAMKTQARKDLDAQVLKETSATTAQGGQRSMVNRRAEFIRNQAQKEASGQKTLADVYSVLDQALQKITSAPVVSA